MQSHNHQFLEFSDQVKQRWIRRSMNPLTGYRLNPQNAVNPNERIDFLLATPEDNVEIVPYDTDKSTEVKQVKFDYTQEVLELYTDVEVRAFLRMNRLLIENGLLVPYEESAPEVNVVNVLKNSEIQQLVKLKNTDLFKGRVDEITSLQALKQLLLALEGYEDSKHTHVKYVQGKINELNAAGNT